MTFGKQFNLLLKEDIDNEDNYQLISPLDYTDVVIITSSIPHKDEHMGTFFKIVDNKKENTDFLYNKKIEKEVMEDMRANWHKRHVVWGLHLIFKHNSPPWVDGAFHQNSLYIVKNPEEWVSSERYGEEIDIAYLKPTGVSKRVKDKFDELYS